jgi:hypothetical protein
MRMPIDFTSPSVTKYHFIKSMTFTLIMVKMVSFQNSLHAHTMTWKQGRSLIYFVKFNYLFKLAPYLLQMLRNVERGSNSTLNTEGKSFLKGLLFMAGKFLS